jgi:hypothetical protein
MVRKTIHFAPPDAVAATSDAMSPPSPASLTTVSGLLPTVPEYSPSPETNRSEAGRRRTNSR